MIFGQKYRFNFDKNKSYETIICGYNQNSIKIKKISSGNKMEYLMGKERFEAEKVFV